MRFFCFGDTSTHLGISGYWNEMSYILKEVVPLLKDGDWGEIKYGNAPQYKVHIKSKADFLQRFIDPSLERGREVMAAYDEISSEARQAYEQAVADRVSVAVRPNSGMGTVEASRQRGNETRQAIAACKAENPTATHQEIADAVGIDRSRVTQLAPEVGIPAYRGDLKESSLDDVNSGAMVVAPELTSQSDRADENGISLAAQKQLDTIARLNPDLIPQIRTPNNPTGTISISRAYQEATGKKPLKRFRVEWTERDDLEAIADRLEAKIKAEFGEDAIARFGAIWESRQ